MTRKLTFLLVLLSLVSSLAACNTVEGMGKDVESGGHHVEEGAKDAKKSL